MEDMQNQNSQVQSESSVSEQPSGGVTFPTVGQPRKSSGGKTLLIIGILILIAVLGYIIFKNSSTGESEEILPTPFETTETSTPVASPTATPKPADKSKVKIEVQNGTGITGEAAYLQNQLKTLGYTNVTVGNASSQDATVTTVTFSKTLAASLVEELTTKLKELYKEVETKTSSTATIDAVIVTGLRKGATTKPAATATAKSSATPTATAKASTTPTPTATAN